MKIEELIARVIEEAAEDKARQERKKYDPVKQKPENAKVFPDSEVGSLLWGGDMDDGFYDAVVVAKDHDNHCLVCVADVTEEPYHRVQWATDYYFPSLAEAIAAAARSDVKYHAPRLAFAEQALDAIERGESLERFQAGLERANDA